MNKPVDNTALVRAHYAAAEREDLTGLAQHFAQDIVWSEGAGSPTPGTFIGVAAVLDGVFSRSPQMWTRFRVCVDSVLDAGNHVVVLGRYDGVHRGTGRPVGARTAHVWRVESGRLVAFEEITDSVEALQAVMA